MTNEASNGKSDINASNSNDNVAVTNSTTTVTVTTKAEVEAVVEMAPAAAAEGGSTSVVASATENGDKKNFLCGVIEGELDCVCAERIISFPWVLRKSSLTCKLNCSLFSQFYLLDLAIVYRHCKHLHAFHWIF